MLELSNYNLNNGSEAEYREELYQHIHDKEYREIWVEFQDELNVDKAIYAFDPPSLLINIIQKVAEGRAGIVTKEHAYECIDDLVNQFVESIATRRAMNTYESR